MKPHPPAPGPVDEPLPSQSARRNDPLIDQEYAVFRRMAFALAVMGAVVAILYPYSPDAMDVNPLAGPLILVASGGPVLALCGAIISGLCLSGMLSVIIWTNERTVAAAGLAVATWLVSSIFLLKILAS